MTDKEIQTRRGYGRIQPNGTLDNVAMHVFTLGNNNPVLIVSIQGATHAEIEAQLERLKGVCKYTAHRESGIIIYMSDAHGGWTSSRPHFCPVDGCGKRVEVVE